MSTAREFHIVVYKPDPKSTKEYMCVIDDVPEYKKWLDGERSIAVNHFTSGLVYASETGSQGKWLTPSTNELSADFQATNEDGDPVDEEGNVIKKHNKRTQNQIVDEAVKKVLEQGHLQTSKTIGTGGFDMQTSKGSGFTTGVIGHATGR